MLYSYEGLRDIYLSKNGFSLKLLLLNRRYLLIDINDIESLARGE